MTTLVNLEFDLSIRMARDLAPDIDNFLILPVAYEAHRKVRTLCEARFGLVAKIDQLGDVFKGPLDSS